MSRLHETDYRILRARLKMLGFSSYDAYLASHRWKQRVRDFVAADPDRRECAVCRRLSGVVPHHMTYERLGEERPEDLLPLCKSCHHSVHRILDARPVSDTPAAVELLKRITEPVKKRKRK